MDQSKPQSISETALALLDFLVEHEQEVRQLFDSKKFIDMVSNPFNIEIHSNVTLTNQVDARIYESFKDFCKEKKIKVKAALMRAMLDLIQNYKDFT